VAANPHNSLVISLFQINSFQISQVSEFPVLFQVSEESPGISRTLGEGRFAHLDVTKVADGPMIPDRCMIIERHEYIVPDFLPNNGDAL